MKKSMLLLSLLAAAVILIGAGVGEEQTPLPVSTVATTVDGVVHEDEYTFSRDFSALKLFVNRSADILCLGIVANTTGWVGVGLGSLRMDGATIFIGYVGEDGSTRLKAQTGTGHTHGDVSGDIRSTIVSYAMKEADGKTTLEIALKSSAYIVEGQRDLDLIFAMGQEKSFLPHHIFRSALRLRLGP